MSYNAVLSLAKVEVDGEVVERLGPVQTPFFFQGDKRRDRAVINNVDTSFKSFFLEHVIELAQQDES
jgi:hypothetical protein